MGYTEWTDSTLGARVQTQPFSCYQLAASKQNTENGPRVLVSHSTGPFNCRGNTLVRKTQAHCEKDNRLNMQRRT